MNEDRSERGSGTTSGSTRVSGIGLGATGGPALSGGSAATSGQGATSGSGADLTSAVTIGDGLDAMIESVLRDRPLEDLPKGFVARTVERATGRPPFRLHPIDFAWPVLVTALAIGAARIPIAVADGAGPLWLRRALLWSAETWSAWSPLPPPPPAAGAVMLASFVAVLIAWATTHTPPHPRRPLGRGMGPRTTIR